MGELTIACSDPDLLRERLYVSQGIQLDCAEASFLNYQDWAIVPTKPELAEPEQLSRIITSCNDAASGSVHLLPMPSGVAAVERLTRLSMLTGDDQREYTTESQPNLLTTTQKDNVGAFVGVHIDSKDNKPRNLRPAESRRRLGWNLGPGSRWLIVAAMDIYDILDGLDNHDPAYIPKTGDVRRYGREKGVDGFQFVWLRLLPYDAYVASTEERPHDGSTAGETQVSRIAFWLGEHAISIARGIA
jgi:hypothetical protein